MHGFFLQFLLKKEESCFQALLTGLEKNKKQNVITKLQQTLQEDSEEEEETMTGK